MGQFSNILGKFSLIKQVPIFSKLRWFELRTIARKSALLEFKKGDIIYKEPSSSEAFFCLVSGRLQAYSLRPNGEKSNVEYVHKGMYFGIISLLSNDRHPFIFEALNDSVVLRFEKDDFSHVLESIPRLGVELSHNLSRRIKSREAYLKPTSASAVVAVYSPVKGSGSSTYAINLAFSLERETAKRVIFVSINSGLVDPAQSHSQDGESSPKWKKEFIQLKDIIGNHEKILHSVHRGELKIDLLNVVFDPEDSWLISQISQFVSHLANDYHYVVVDLPNETDEIVLATLTQSDLIHLVTRDKEEDLRLTQQMISRLKQALRENFAKEKTRVIISGLEPKPYLSYSEVAKMIDHDVYTTLPQIMHQELNVAVVGEALTVITPNLQSEYAKTVTRIARRIGGVLVGLVLGGGAALGIAHIGVIRVLERENIPIDIVVGSSIGALIGSLWVTGKNADDLETVAREFEKKAAIFKLMDIIVPSRSGLVRGINIRRWLKKHLADKTFYSARIPFKVVAYDLIHRQELVLDEGSLIDAVRQSIAIPGVITPIVRNERLIIDGGVVNPLPTNVLTNLGIKRIIAVNVLQSPDDVSKGYDMLKRQLREEIKVPFLKSPRQYIAIRFNQLLAKIFSPNIFDIIVRSLQATEYVIAEQSAQQADIVVHPELAGVNWFELYRVDQLIKSGEEAALTKLSAIKKLISE